MLTPNKKTMFDVVLDDGICNLCLSDWASVCDDEGLVLSTSCVWYSCSHLTWYWQYCRVELRCFSCGWQEVKPKPLFFSDDKDSRSSGVAYIQSEYLDTYSDKNTVDIPGTRQGQGQNTFTSFKHSLPGQLLDTAVFLGFLHIDNHGDTQYFAANISRQLDSLPITVSRKLK